MNKTRVATLGSSIRSRDFQRLFCVWPLVLMFFGAAFCPSLFASERSPSKNVLILYSFSDRDLFDSPEFLKSAVRARVQVPVSFHVEYMESDRFGDAGYEKSLSDSLRDSFEGEKLDLVIVAALPALRFAIEHRDQIFPGAPIIFCYVDAGRMRNQKLPPDVTGVSGIVDVKGSIELAFRLNPDTKNVAVISGNAEFDRYWLQAFHNEFLSFAKRAKLIDLAIFPSEQLMRQISTLPPHTVVFVQATPQFSTQPVLGTYDTIAEIARHLPTYCIFSNYCVGHGGIGGSFADYPAQAIMTADEASRILAGEKPESIPVVHDSVAHAVVDWRQLQRWGIPESTLPAGNIVLHRRPTLWEQHRNLILSGIALLVLQGLLIFYLLWQRGKRRSAERSLVERLAFEHLISDLSTTCINLRGEQLGAVIHGNLGRIAEFLRVDSIAVFEFSPQGTNLKVAFSWCAAGVQPVQTLLSTDQASWWAPRLVRGEPVLVSGLEELPEDASPEKERLWKLGVISAATVPLRAGDELFGGVSFVTTKRRVLWTGELVEQLQLLAEIFSNALMRTRAEKLQSMHAAIVESSDDAIISKDLHGIILSWNGAAQRLFGFTETEAVGQPIAIVIPTELRDEEDDILRRLRLGEHIVHYETIRVGKSGKRIDVSLTISPLRDSGGSIVGVSMIARDITGRKQAEQILRESRDRFRLVADASPVLIWMSGTDKLCTFFNEGWLDFTGRLMEQELGDGWASGVHPHDFERCLRIYSEAFDARVNFEMEYRLRRFDGEYRWVLDRGVARSESNGTFLGYIGSCVDITDRRLSEEALRELSGRMINAQEEERARIARELHDDFSQRLALQCIALQQLWKKLPVTDGEGRTKIQKILKGTQEMSADMHSLSHQLHSSKLEHVGLAPALMGLCEEITAKYKIHVEFAEIGNHGEIPVDVALCFFRIAQEALGNVVKHSQARQAHAELSAASDEIRLRIVDAGVGFDPILRSPHAGIGLVGMRERLRLVGGILSVKSAPMRGTEIFARVPLPVAARKERVRVWAAGMMQT